MGVSPRALPVTLRFSRLGAMETAELLQEIKTRLQAAHGARLKGVVLYGSRARGDAQPDSDYDVLVLLEGPIQLSRDVHASTVALRTLVWELDAPIDAQPVDYASYLQKESPLYVEAAREGIVA
jgi:predicted nucleotidyltransferase